MDLLAAMTTFVTIVDQGSLTKAAEQLERSQPSVVRALGALEAHLGVRLLQRTTRRMSLTPEGNEFLQRCRQILSDVTDAERSVSQHHDLLQGQLRITAPVQFGQRHVVPLLNQFLAANPGIQCDIVLLDRNVDLIEEGVDLAVRIGPLADSSLIAVPVGHLKRYVCASPGLIKKTGEPQSPEQLAQMPCIRFQNLARPSIWQFTGAPTNISVKVTGPVSCNQIASGVAACVDGLGYGQFLSYQVEEELKSGALTRVLTDFEWHDIPVHLVYSDRRLTTARQKAITQFLKPLLKNRIDAI